MCLQDVDVNSISWTVKKIFLTAVPAIKNNVVMFKALKQSIQIDGLTVIIVLYVD
jgi:hypothetical protein